MVASRPFARAARVAAEALRRRAADRVHAAERIDLSPAAAAFVGLHPSSLAFARLRTTRAPRRLNLVLPNATPWNRFAGVETAFVAAAELARRLGCGMRVVETDIVPRSRVDRSRMIAVLADRFPGLAVELVERSASSATTFGDDDVWVATHWTTAHALQVAARVSVLDPARVVYLIQDFEPGFVPWSTDYALAADTYTAGFIPLVNSSAVARMLESEANLTVPREQVFAPDLDVDRLAELAARRTPGNPPRVLFYARPSKPRNLFTFGRAALNAAALRLPDEVDFVAAGEPVPRDDTGRLRSLGRLSWDAYFDLLADVDVVVSLQLSAHPSHPPLEAAVSGALAVTNEFGGTRAGLHRRLMAVGLSLDALSDAIVDAVRCAPSRDTTYGPIKPGALGGPLDAAVQAVARQL